MTKKFILLSLLLLLFTISKAQLTDTATIMVNNDSDISQELNIVNEGDCNPVNQESDKLIKDKDYTAAIVYAVVGGIILAAALISTEWSKEYTEYVVCIGALTEVLAVMSAVQGKNVLDDGGKGREGFLGKP